MASILILHLFSKHIKQTSIFYKYGKELSEITDIDKPFLTNIGYKLAEF